VWDSIGDDRLAKCFENPSDYAHTVGCQYADKHTQKKKYFSFGIFVWCIFNVDGLWLKSQKDTV